MLGLVNLSCDFSFPCYMDYAASVPDSVKAELLQRIRSFLASAAI